MTPVGVFARVHSTNRRCEPRRRSPRYSPTICVPFSIKTTLPESDITSRKTTQETKPGTSDDIAVSNTQGIAVP